MRPAAAASMLRSTSQRATTSTGATWIMRQRSLLPYQPQPMRATRFFCSSAAEAERAPRASAAREVERMNWRRFMVLKLRKGFEEVNWDRRACFDLLGKGHEP